MEGLVGLGGKSEPGTWLIDTFSFLPSIASSLKPALFSMFAVSNRRFFAFFSWTTFASIYYTIALLHGDLSPEFHYLNRTQCVVNLDSVYSSFLFSESFRSFYVVLFYRSELKSLAYRRKCGGIGMENDQSSIF
ncbi:unnamed protein product [Heligmosomoides polygyrus]|uniref:IRK domain-containing protein n=1 Tax=Heligmosomoides polygyrus TaxID=6339 RepID=A0A183FE87_HELPZ|nr:unnamed protein product [Heligmosomoides polygyrus]